MKARLVSFASGLVFAFGLVLSGMTRPEKVLGFLNVAGDWDPSLMMVMVGAIGVHVFFARRALRMSAPVLAPAFMWSTRKGVDARLVLGSAIFGVGWGLGGLCPGPALVSLPSLTPSTLGFAAAMAFGMVLVNRHDAVDHLRSGD